MIYMLCNARQPIREAWPPEKLLQMRAYLMSCALNKSSQKSYSSALNSYITFCDLHHLDLEPTPDTLSFYVMYMCTFIEP